MTEKEERGILINQHAALGSEIVRLLEIIPELMKTAKKTPPKTLVAEKTKVTQAKVLLENATLQLQKALSQHQELTNRLHSMQAWGNSPRGELMLSAQKAIEKILE